MQATSDPACPSHTENKQIIHSICSVFITFYIDGRLYVGRILHHVDSQSSGKISSYGFLNVFAHKSWKKIKKEDLQHIRLQSKLVELGSNISREKEIPLSLYVCEAFLPQLQSDTNTRNPPYRAGHDCRTSSTCTIWSYAISQATFKIKYFFFLHRVRY